VVDQKLAPRPAITPLAETGDPGAPGAAAVTITPGIEYALATVMVRRNQTELLTRRLRETSGFELPATPRRVAAGATAFAWAGPGTWLAMAEGTDGAAFEARLRAALAGLASVSDQTDGRVVVRLRGPRARDTLAKGLPIDLHPRAFAPGDTVLTTVSYMAIHIWQIDTAPTYEIAVSRSFAVSFFQWLVSAAAEFRGRAGMDTRLGHRTSPGCVSE
jgi:heterotetrameric sarcosine oxidase gamma subunit